MSRKVKKRPDCSGRTVLSLFDYSGNWSQPYFLAGANIFQLDLKHGFDINELNAAWFYENVFEQVGTIDGILAAPPCTDFSSSGAQYWQRKDEAGITRLSIELVYQVLRCVDLCQPDWWVLENPVGRLNKLVPQLAQYGPIYIQPYDYGDPYSKKTGLWGEFILPEPISGTNPEKVCAQGSWIQKLGGKSERTKELRSTTPKGFAHAFFMANCWQHSDWDAA